MHTVNQRKEAMKTATKKRSLWAVLITIFALVLSACSGATLKTELNLDDANKGSRVMNLTIENSSDNSDSVKGGNDAIDASIKKHLPEGLEFSGITTEGDTAKGTFTIKFDSVDDYRKKVEGLLKASGKDITPPKSPSQIIRMVWLPVQLSTKTSHLTIC